MAAKRVPRIRLEGRTDLSKAIPLDTPLHLFIDPSSACNFKCRFCFNHHEAHHEIMKFDLFKKIIDDCREFPHRIKAIRLYGFGEPLLNKNLHWMVRYAKGAGVTEFVEFTTNGWWLSHQTSRDLISAGLDAITVSVPGMTREKIKEVCGKEIDFEAYRENIEFFYSHRSNCRVHVKLTNYDLSQKEEDQFYRMFEEVADEVSVDNIVPIWPGMPGVTQKDPEHNIYMREIQPVDVCPYIFYHMTVHANGDVSTCFVDWNHQNLLGNVKGGNLVDLWRGTRLHRIRVDQLLGCKRGICIGCGQLKYGQADSIGDPKEILKRIGA
jgi:MoaA/NifB/PqqE/SkfB family radical SAM enzyme